MILGAGVDVGELVTNQLQECDVGEGATGKSFQHCAGDQCFSALREVIERETDCHSNGAAHDKDEYQDKGQQEACLCAHQSNAKGQRNDGLVNGNTKKNLESLWVGRWVIEV